MAGSWPNAPGRRMSWDTDGTVALVFGPQVKPIGGGAPSGSGNTIMAPNDFSVNAPGGAGVLNGEDWGQIMESLATNFTQPDGQNRAWYSNGFAGGGAFMHIGWVFPELRDIDGFHTQYGKYFGTIGSLLGVEARFHDLETSVDTTTGVDGTWGIAGAGTGFTTGPHYYLKNYRDFNQIPGPLTLSETSKRGIRFLYEDPVGASFDGQYLNKVHIYGGPSGGQTPDRILFMDAASGAPVDFTGPVDWGDRPRGTSLERDLVIRNNSGTLTANSIDLDFQGSAYPGAVSWFQINIGSGLGASANIASLAPGADQAATIRMTIPDAATPNVYAAKMRARVGNWT